MTPHRGRDVTHSLVLGSKMNVTSSGGAQLEARRGSWTVVV